MNVKTLALLGLLALFAWTKPASAETYHGCNGYITAVPVTISNPGTLPLPPAPISARMNWERPCAQRYVEQQS